MYATQSSDESPTSPSGTTMLPHVSLEIVRGQAREKVRQVTTPAFLIGSAPDCDLVLGDPQFPQVYAYLIVHTGGVLVRHLGFPPELTVNGRAASRVALRDGDRLRLGPYEFVVRVERRRPDITERGRSLFGSVPLGALNHSTRESEVEALAISSRLLDDVRQALGITSPAVSIPAAAAGRGVAVRSGLAAS